MSKVWSFLIIFSISISFITNSFDNVINIIMSSSKSAVENVITLIGIMCFWNGIFNIFEKTSAIDKFSDFFKKPLGFLFGKNKLSDESLKYVSLNMASNLVGVGNASTINGLKAIESMQKDNFEKDKPSDSMTIFVLLNTASLQLIPTSIIALRAMYGSEAPSSIVLPIWIVTILSLCAGIFAIKFLNKRI